MSIYDPIDVGPVRMIPGMINGDYIQVEVVNTSPDADAPYISDGVLYVPVKTWEKMQVGETS
jgi:hypothetical protein